MDTDVRRTEPARPLEDVPTKTLLRDLFHDTTRLFQKEVELARAEMGSELKSVLRRAAEMAVAGVLALLGVALLCTAAVLGLAAHMTPWVAALVVAIVLFVLAGVGFAVAKKRGTREPLERTRRTVKEDVQWAKNPTA